MAGELSRFRAGNACEVYFFKCWVTGQCGIVVGGVMSAVEEFVKSPS